MLDRFSDWVTHTSAGELILLAGLIVAAIVVHALTHWIGVGALHRFIRGSTITWDDTLVERRVFERMAWVAPAIVVYFGTALIPNLSPTLTALIQRVAVSLVVAVAAFSINAFLSAVHDVYSAHPEYRHRPIKGYVQVVKIMVVLVAALIVVSTLLDRSPWIFLSGLGALTAVLLLIFKDTILSLVASVQIASNDMIHVGDWIEMPQAGVDGDVIDVALHTVKVQNWDKTISTIPTHKFIDESFKNWRGMSLSGGRRIKRSIHIDMNSIRFLDADDIERFRGWALLRDYIDEKCRELEQHNLAPGRNQAINADIRRLTNIGTFRAYVVAYIKAHPKIHHEGYTLLVRQLAPGPTGLPIEIYCFSNEQAWAVYEGIQADILDHILAIVPEFDLCVFQSPSGVDFERLAPLERGS